jgi:hypothetical protein
MKQENSTVRGEEEGRKEGRLVLEQILALSSHLAPKYLSFDSFSGSCSTIHPSPFMEMASKA